MRRIDTSVAPVDPLDVGSLAPYATRSGETLSSNRIDLSNCVLELKAEGYVLCDQHREVEQTDVTAQAFLDGVARLQPGGALVVVRMNGQSTSAEARAKIARAREFKAVAMVLSSRVGAMLANFFSRMNKPGFQFRVFNHETEAIEWVLRQK